MKNREAVGFAVLSSLFLSHPLYNTHDTLSVQIFFLELTYYLAPRAP
jgi:hypothetical protein